MHVARPDPIVPRSIRTAREQDRTPAEQQAAMRWAQRLKRVFQIDVETCPSSGGTVKVIASIEDPRAMVENLGGSGLG